MIILKLPTTPPLDSGLRRNDGCGCPWIPACAGMTDEVSVEDGKGVKGASRWAGDAAPFRVRWGNLALAILII